MSEPIDHLLAAIQLAEESPRDEGGFLTEESRSAVMQAYGSVDQAGQQEQGQKDMSAMNETAGGALREPPAQGRSTLVSPFRNRKSLSTHLSKGGRSPEEKEAIKEQRRIVRRYADEINDAYRDIPNFAGYLDDRLKQFLASFSAWQRDLISTYLPVEERRRLAKEIMRQAHGLAARLSLLRVEQEDMSDLRQTVDALRRMTLAANRMDDSLIRLGQIGGKSLPSYHTKDGFTGRKEDSIGREMCYENGHRVACNAPKMKPSSLRRDKPKETQEQEQLPPTLEPPPERQITEQGVLEPTLMPSEQMEEGTLAPRELSAKVPPFMRQWEDYDYSEEEQAAANASTNRDDRDAVRKLEKSPITSAKAIGNGGINDSYIIELQEGGKGVFKPVEGQTNRKIIGGQEITVREGIEGSIAAREVACSSVARILGFADLVPATVYREAEGRRGTCQQFVTDAKEAKSLDNPWDGKQDLARSAVFDYLVGHLDRHMRNWMKTDAGKLVLIDNGLSFPSEYVQSDWFNMEIMNRAVKQELEIPDISDWKGKWPEIEAALKKDGMDEKAVKLAKGRFDAIIEVGAGGRIADLPGLVPGYDKLSDLMRRQRR